MLGVEIITVIALAAPWPVLALLGWIFYRAARADRTPAAEAVDADPPVDAS